MSKHTGREEQANAETASERQTRQRTMLEEALRQPGIREVMTVYEDWRAADSGLDPYRGATKEGMTITTTNHANA